MKKNKKGQMIFIGIMVFIMAFIVLVQFISPLKDQITTARGASNLDCTNTSISTGTKATCVVVDTSLFYFVGVCIFAAAGYLTAKGIKYRFSPPQS